MNKISLEKIQEIKSFHAEGYTNLKISELTNVNKNTILRYLKKLGLKSNGKTIHNIPIIDEKYKCVHCDTLYEDIFTFQVMRPNSKDSYRLSYCSKCKLERRKNNKINSLNSYFRSMFQNVKCRAKKYNLPFDLDVNYLEDLYKSQEGKCFYTDILLTLIFDRGFATLSIDKVIPEKGYIKGNVVFCCHKINSCKNNLSLEDISKWMPGWYERIIKLLKNNNGK